MDVGLATTGVLDWIGCPITGFWKALLVYTAVDEVLSRVFIRDSLLYCPTFMLDTCKSAFHGPTLLIWDTGGTLGVCDSVCALPHFSKGKFVSCLECFDLSCSLGSALDIKETVLCWLSGYLLPVHGFALLTEWLSSKLVDRLLGTPWFLFSSLLSSELGFLCFSMFFGWWSSCQDENPFPVPLESNISPCPWPSLSSQLIDRSLLNVGILCKAWPATLVSGKKLADP